MSDTCFHKSSTWFWCTLTLRTMDLNNSFWRSMPIKNSDIIFFWDKSLFLWYHILLEMFTSFSCIEARTKASLPSHQLCFTCWALHRSLRRRDFRGIHMLSQMSCSLCSKIPPLNKSGRSSFCFCFLISKLRQEYYKNTCSPFPKYETS